MTEALTQPGVLASLGVNGKLFAAQLVNFAVIIFVVWKWVYKPLLKTMDAREQKIVDGLSHAEQAKKILAESEAKQTEMLKTARQESQRMVEAAQQEAEAERKRLMAETSAELERQLADVRERLKGEKLAMMQTVKNEVADLVLAATEKVARSMDAKAQHALVTEAISELETSV
jgi:F-type H+-transporting ATPase subunit b